MYKNLDRGAVLFAACAASVPTASFAVSTEAEILDYWGKTFEGVSAILLGAATLLLTAISILAAFIIWKTDKYQKNFESEFKDLRSQYEKTSHLIFVVSNLSLTALPKITFTQQVPVSILENLGIVDETFSGEAGAKLWASITNISIATPRDSAVGRLAFARAVYRLGRNPDDRDLLLGKEDADPQSVIGLLKIAEKTTRNSSDMLSADILLRKCQAFRQAGKPDDLIKAEEVASDLIATRWNLRIGQYHLWGPWCMALVNLQRAALEHKPQAKAEFYRKSAHLLEEYYIQLPNREQKSGPGLSENKETGSYLYYMAKSLWSFKMSSIDGEFDEARRKWPDIGVKLGRYIIDTIISLEDFMRRDIRSQETQNSMPLDLSIRAIYNFCLAFVITVALELPETRDNCAKEISRKYADLDTATRLRGHAEECLHQAEKSIFLIQDASPPGTKAFIYCERKEKLDSTKVFLDDIAWVKGALSGQADQLSLFYRGE